MNEITSEYLASQGLNHTFPQRFWSKVQKTKSCWIWTAGKDPKGYGKIHRGTKINWQISAHLASWILSVGPVPKGLCVLHNCPGGDNPACVNPDHLWLGTKQQNTMDAVRKGTWKASHPVRYGEQASRHKLKQAEVLEIRQLHLCGAFNQRELARMFGVHFGTINDIVLNKKWKHAI